MANERVRAIHQFVSVSGAGKKQSAFGAFQPNADLDVRDKCVVTISDNVNRRIERDCDDVDIIREPILDRDTVITLDYTQNGINAQMLARWFGYLLSTAAAPTGATTNEVQTLTRSGTVSGGTFTITLVHEGKTGVTEAIAYDASTAVILAALLKKTGSATAMGKLLKSGDVTVGGDWTAGITLTFAGRMAAANMALVTIGNGSITGGGTIVAAQTTAGDQRLHVFTRTTDATLALFSLITGDKNGAYDDFKYGDCVVDNIAITTEQAAGALLGVIVTIFCNYTPSREAAYSAPACVSISPIKVEDCKVKTAGSWETADLAALTANFNNNIPREAAFAYDDIDISNAYQRGDQPDQGFTASIYGSPDTALYQLAEAEETDGNDTDFTLYLGQMGNRMTITGADTKIKFQNQRLGFAGPLRQSTINIIATPYNSPPLTYSASVSQTATYLTASS
jgi:hypothetical protein